MELDQMIEQIGLPYNRDEDSVLYSTERTSFYIRGNNLQYSSFVPASSRHRFNVLVEALPDNVLAYNFREWFRQKPLRELIKIQNQDPEGDQREILFLRKDIQKHIPELIELIQNYFSRFAAGNP